MIRKHNMLQLPLFVGMSGAYILFKYCFSPFLWAIRKAGLKSNAPKIIDSKINRIILPLTERSDEEIQRDNDKEIQKGNPLPQVKIRFSDGSTLMLNKFTDSALLLIFIRGSWCSYSRLHLADITSKSKLFDERGIKLIAVTSYTDQQWWKSKDINMPMIIDKDGELFSMYGIKVKSWIEYAWGRVLPYEGAFFYSSKGELIEYDYRNVNSLIPGQKFLSADTWLKIADKKL